MTLLDLPRQRCRETRSDQGAGDGNRTRMTGIADAIDAAILQVRSAIFDLGSPDIGWGARTYVGATVSDLVPNSEVARIGLREQFENDEARWLDEEMSPA
jgi:hypothetical protein